MLKTNIVHIEGNTFGNNGYNCLEIGLNGSVLPDNIQIRNCKFDGTFSNNAISIFGTQDNTHIIIENCTFKKVSNVLRISNRTNASGVIIKIKNCTITEWETDNNYAGMILCQDYTSAASKVDENNLFGANPTDEEGKYIPKIAISIQNCTGPNGPISFENAGDVCATHNKDTQILYVYRDKGTPKLLDYEPFNFPMIVCNEELPDEIPAMIATTGSAGGIAMEEEEEEI